MQPNSTAAKLNIQQLVNQVLHKLREWCCNSQGSVIVIWLWECIRDMKLNKAMLSAGFKQQQCLLRLLQDGVHGSAVAIHL